MEYYLSMINYMKIRATLAGNLHLLSETTGDSFNMIAKNAKVSPSMVGNIKNMTSNVSVETLEKITTYYRIPIWLMFLPDLKSTDFSDKQIGETIKNYLNSDTKGRNALSVMAEREALFSKNADDYPNLGYLQEREKSS